MGWPKWKKLEKDVADFLGWTRVVRADNYANSDVDIDPPEGFKYLKVDTKKHKKFLQHKLMAEIERKYCLEDGDEPVLVTQETINKDNPRTKPGQKLPTYVTIRLELFKEMVEAYIKENKNGRE